MWNNYRFFKEAKIQQDISKIEQELKSENKINFESIFKNRNTVLEDAIKSAIHRAFLKNNLNFEYDQNVHEFLRKDRKDILSIATFLNNVETTKIRTILRALKQEKIENVVLKITEDYQKDFKPYGITKEEFSHLLQSTRTGVESIQPIIQKIGIEKVSKLQTKISGTYIRNLTNPKSGALTLLLFGRIEPEIREKLNTGPEIEALFAEFQMSEGEVKQEVLMSSEFSPIIYPLRPENYWPPLKDDYSNILETKILDTFDLNNPIPAIQGISSAKFNTVAIGDEPNRIKALFKNQFQSNEDKLLDYVANVFIKNNNPIETVKSYVEQIKNSVDKTPKDDTKPRRKDSLFPEMESYFDSIKEKEIVDLVRDEFNLTCVQSAMQFPITNDFTMNKKNFITDFVIYCDAFDGFKEEERDGIKIEVPLIKNRLLLIGEYYGYYSDLKSKPLKEDLINPDGTPFLKDNGQPAVVGDVLTIGEEYKFKTKYKIITNDFCGKAIGCKTISVHQANSRKEQRSEVAKGLEENNVIYNSESKDVEIKSGALINLMKWYRNASDESKNASKATLSRYFDTETLTKKSGKEYPLAFQNPKNKYLGVIYETIHFIKSKDLFAAIEQSKLNYSIKTIKNPETANNYLMSLAPERRRLTEQNNWRIESLKNIYKEIQNMPLENGKLQNPINNIEFLKYIQEIKNFANKNVDYSNVFKKKAFNLLENIKKGIIK